MSVRGVGSAMLGAVLALAAAPSHALVSCTTTAIGPAFGIYDQFNPAPLASNGSVTILCSLVSGNPIWVTAEVKLSAGASGSYAARTMLFGAQQLKYNIYLDAAYSQIWGDTTGGSFDWSTTFKLTPGDVTEVLTGVLYGQIPAGQDPGAGAYLDTIVVTVTY